MPIISFQPADKTVTVARGSNLLDACQRAGIGVPASCGGKGLCGKCRVRILEGDVPSNRGHEQALSQVEMEAGWRLACLIQVEGDLTVAADSETPVNNVILTEFTGRDAVVDQAVRSVPLVMAPPTLDDQHCDIGRIAQALEMEGYPPCSLPLLQILPSLLRENDFRINAVLYGEELLGIDPYQEGARVLGMAIDLGTTTVAGALFDLNTGDPLAVAARTNPQAIRGDDVVTRIDHARQGLAEKQELQRLVVEALDEILAETCGAIAASPDEVYFLAAGGNTTMHHLLLGIDPTHIAASPFIAAARRSLMVRSHEIGLKAGHGARLFVLPNISAYVGGDIVAGLLAHRVHESDKTVLLVDVGTNGEMALRADGKTYACSTAAGPAFEGARISSGMRAATGAICRVEAGQEDLRVQTVDEAPARGICGTGLLDAVAALLDVGLLDETGCLVDPDDVNEDCPDLPQAIRNRLIEVDDAPAVVLAFEEEGYPRIVLTQRDIREFQLAKGAVVAGIDVMLRAMGKTSGDLDEVLLAGGFGSYLRPASAVRVGLLPEDISTDRIHAVGNAALAGSRLCLLSQSMRAEADCIAREVEYLELSGRADFQMAFAEGMEFPEGDA